MKYTGYLEFQYVYCSVSERNDKFTSYKMLVSQVSDEKEDYIIGRKSSQQGFGTFEDDALQVIKEKQRFDRLVHSKIYLCALMHDHPITDSDIQSTVERVDEINRSDLDERAYEVLLKLR